MKDRQAQTAGPHAVENKGAGDGRLQHRVGGMWMVLPITFIADASEGAAPDMDCLRVNEPQRIPKPRYRVMMVMPRTPDGLHVTGRAILAIRHPSIGMGFDWRVDLRGVPGAVAHRSDDPALSRGTAATAKAIGNAEIVDLRPALCRVRHPAGERGEPIWSATHVRAVLELAWQRLEGIARERWKTRLRDTYDRRTMRVWLGPTERARAQELGGVMALSSDGIDVEEWNEWLESLTR